MNKTRDGVATGRRRLGRGLESLLSVSAPVELERGDGGDVPRGTRNAPDDVPRGTSETGERIEQLLVEAIAPNPDQPRRTFDETALSQLAQSIRSAGVMQPIIVRRGRDGQYEIVAGERRWRAARLLGIERIPAVVRELADQTVAEWALIENLQREDLNPIERADAFRRLADQYHLTHQEIADLVGLDRSNISNHLRLCDLDEETRTALVTKQIDMGHGKALAGIQDPSLRRRLLRDVVAGSLSVRELERRIREAGTAGKPDKRDAPSSDPLTMHMRDLERRLGGHLGTRVAIRPGSRKGTGSMTIDFYSIDQFEGLLSRMGYTSES